MKKIILFALLQCFAHLLLGQRCGTYDPSDNILMQINGDANATYDIRVYWHWVRQNDGSSANSQQLIEDIISLVKTEYNSIGINLTTSCPSGDDNFNIIDDTFVYNANDNDEAYDDNCFLDGYCIDDGLNVFFTNGKLNGESQGLASIPGNRLYVSLDEIDEWETVVHEIGHCFGLFHTWAARPWGFLIPGTGGTQWRCNQQGGITGFTPTLSDCASTSFSTFVPMELVNGSNSAIAGDFVVDTPADINYAGRCGTDILDCTQGDPCDMDDKDERFRDPNCDAYQPDYNNFMGARVPHCVDHFTNGQVSRMKGVIANLLDYMIIDDVTPALAAVDCPLSEINLNTLHIDDVPYNALLQWSTDGNPDDGIDPIIDPNITTSGAYFAYYYFVNEACHGPASMPVNITLQETIPNVAAQAFNKCPEKSVDLNDQLLESIPANTEVQWLQKLADEQYNPTNSNIVSTSGTYVARYYFIEEDCIGPFSSEIDVVLEDCCDITDDFVILDDMIIANPISFGGNVMVADGATMTINGFVEFGEYKKLIIQDGGTVIISGSSAMLNDCPGAVRWDGIEVQSGGTLIVDEGYIYAAFYAIHALPGSTVDIVNLIVIGSGTYENARIGLWLEGDVNAIQLHKFKIRDYYTGIHCNNSSNYYNFDMGQVGNSNIGIRLDNAPARINDFDIITLYSGIDASQSPGTLIENNYLNTPFDNDYSDTKGINMWWCDGSVIRNNLIGNDWSAPNTGISLFLSNGGTIRDMNIIRGGRTGIYAFNTDFSIIQNDISVVSDYSLNQGAVTLMLGNGNQVLNNYIDAENVTFGINTRLCSGLQIENNDITTTFNATYYRAAGIKSEGSNGEIIENNLINGSGNTDGIIATNTAGNTYDCNHAAVGGNKEALSVLYNSQGQSVKGNDLTANGNDLLIRSIIGEQVHEGNEFKGGNTLAEDIDIAFDSRFYVNSEYSFHKPTEPNYENWFIDEPDVHNYYDCANVPGPTWMPFWDDEPVLCTYYNRIIDKYGYGSTEYLRMIQTILRYGKQRIDYKLPDCIKDDPLLPTCWEALVNAEDKLTTPNDDRDTDRADLLEEVEALSASFDAGNGEAYLASHKDVIAALARSLSSAASEYNLTIQNTKGILNEIDCTDSIISAALPILEEYIRYIETEDKSTFDYNNLIQYSRLCADDYGPYIHLARGIVYPITDEYFDQYDDCRSSKGGVRAAKEVDISSYIYPNPSVGIATLDFGRKTTGHMEVFDIAGKKILSRNLNGDMRIDLDLSDHIGVNLIHIYHHDGTAEVLKHISIK